MNKNELVKKNQEIKLPIERKDSIEKFLFYFYLFYEPVPLYRLI
jgi:hypothetical protein